VDLSAQETFGGWGERSSPLVDKEASDTPIGITNFGKDLAAAATAVAVVGTVGGRDQIRQSVVAFKADLTSHFSSCPLTHLLKTLGPLTLGGQYMKIM